MVSSEAGFVGVVNATCKLATLHLAQCFFFLCKFFSQHNTKISVSLKFADAYQFRLFDKIRRVNKRVSSAEN